MDVQEKLFGIVEKQTNTNTLIVEKLTNIDTKLGNVIEKYDEFSKQMIKIETHINWGIVILIALGVPGAISLIKIAFG